MNENQKGQVYLAILVLIGLLFTGFVIIEDRKDYPCQTSALPCRAEVHTSNH